jgi:hypothetical protein
MSLSLFLTIIMIMIMIMIISRMHFLELSLTIHYIQLHQADDEYCGLKEKELERNIYLHSMVAS